MSVPVPIHKEKNVGFSHAAWEVMDFDSKKDCITIKGSSNSELQRAGFHHISICFLTLSTQVVLCSCGCHRQRSS